MTRKAASLLLTQSAVEDDQVPAAVGMFFAEPSPDKDGWDGFFLDMTQPIDQRIASDRTQRVGERLSSGEPTRIRAIAEAFAAMMERAIEADPSLSWFPEVRVIERSSGDTEG